MDSNYWTFVLPLIGAGVGYYIKHLIEKRKELLSEVNKERRELYQKFINLVVDIMKGVKSHNSKQSKFIADLFEFYKKYILYASPEVINRLSDYFQYLYREDKKDNTEELKFHFRKLTAIMIAMRKDLGLSNKKLGKDGSNLMRALLIDFDSIIK